MICLWLETCTNSTAETAHCSCPCQGAAKGAGTKGYAWGGLARDPGVRLSLRAEGHRPFGPLRVTGMGVCVGSRHSASAAPLAPCCVQALGQAAPTSPTASRTARCAGLRCGPCTTCGGSPSPGAQPGSLCALQPSVKPRSILRASGHAARLAGLLETRSARCYQWHSSTQARCQQWLSTSNGLPPQTIARATLCAQS